MLIALNCYAEAALCHTVGADGGQWRLGSPNTFSPTLASPNPTIPLHLTVRPLKPIRSNTQVEVSLFMVKKGAICRHLDTTIVTARDSAFEHGKNDNRQDITRITVLYFFNLFFIFSVKY